MSYQVLARKWRPQTFDTTIGQQHVLQAIKNALEQNRLHHAYLFTGTRGVGKTTIARILAKSLNCEEGISATPCGRCSACQEIEQGRFVDLIEVDAASRTKVEDTRELLDNVQYAPARGRYKIYLIDEVHMLSGHSFNALLKTLEEPPPHVKFLLATTDPQKLPVTVLSRCLQFHLKTLSIEQISSHLQAVLTSETITFEEPALLQLAKAANGSIRDSLSLLEQAISYCQGELTRQGVSEMLGIIDQDSITPVLRALCEKNGEQLLQEVSTLAEKSIDFAQVLNELASTLHYITIAQTAPEAITRYQTHAETIQQLSERLTPEETQLFYQIAITGKRDLSLAPDPRTGFEMTLLRMLAFQPAARKNSSPTQQTSQAQAPSSKTVEPATTQAATPTTPAQKSSSITLKADNWSTTVEKLNISGMTKLLASNCSFENFEDQHLLLLLKPEHSSLLNDRAQARLADALEQLVQQKLKVEISISDKAQDSPLQQTETKKETKRQEAYHSIAKDPGMREMINTFDANLSPDFIKPNN